MKLFPEEISDKEDYFNKLKIKPGTNAIRIVYDFLLKINIYKENYYKAWY